MKRKHIKRYLIDYSFGFLYSTLFYTPLGIFLWEWSEAQCISYVITSIAIAAVSGRLNGALLNRWRGLFGERKQ